MFLHLSVSHSVHGGGCLAPPARHLPRTDTPGQITPWADTPLLSRHPQVETPWSDTPQPDTPLPSASWDTHPSCPVYAMIHTPPAQCMLGYDQQAGGTHPTGMHSCLTKLVSVVVQLSPVFRSYYIVEKGGLFVFELERLTLNFFMGQIFLNPFLTNIPYALRLTHHCVKC